MKTITALFIVLIALTGCNKTAEHSKPIPISEFQFESIFGTHTGEASNIYCLLGQGFFRTPRSEDADSLINVWIKEHPNPVVIPVSVLFETEIDNPESKQTYCWVVDKKDTLNVFLIRNGCFPGGTMQRPKAWEEMTNQEKELFKGPGMEGQRPKVKVYINQKDYDAFIEKIKAAEEYASDNMFGIWKDDAGEE